MGHRNCHESPDGFHEVCKRSMSIAGSEVWDNFAPHLLACLFITGVFITGICVWRMRAGRGRNGREPVDHEWQAGKGSLAAPRMPVHHLIIHDDPALHGLDSSKDGPYKDEKMSFDNFFKAGC